MSKSGGIWTLTEDGQRALDGYPDPETFKRRAREGYLRWEQCRDSSGAEPEEESDDEQAPPAFGALEEAEDKAALEIKAHIVELNPYDFQELVAGLLEGMGYHVVWVAPRGADGGMDAIAYSDALGVSGPTIRASAKREARGQDVGEVRSFLATLQEGDVGIFVATGGFTKEAERLARSDRRKLRLVDLERFIDLWKQCYLRVPEVRRNLLPLKPVHFLIPSETG